MTYIYLSFEYFDKNGRRKKFLFKKRHVITNGAKIRYADELIHELRNISNQTGCITEEDIQAIVRQYLAWFDQAPYDYEIIYLISEGIFKGTQARIRKNRL